MLSNACVGFCSRTVKKVKEALVSSMAAEEVGFQ